MTIFYFLVIIAAVLALIGVRKLLYRTYRLQYDLNNYERERQIVLDFFNQIGHQFTTRVELERTIKLIVNFAQEACRADAAAIFVREDGTNVLKPRAVEGLFPPLHNPSTDKLLAKRKFVVEKVMKDVIEIGEGLIGRVAETGHGMLIKDAVKDVRVPPEAGAVIPLRDLILQPLICRGEVKGVIVLVNKRIEGPFDEADQSLVTALAEQAALALDIVKLYKAMEEKQRMEQELSVAMTFQRLLLPREQPSYEGWDIFGYSEPALEVGGDYYDFISLDDDHLGIAIADVSGKGIPGALVMATVRSTLQAQAPLSLSPKAVLMKVNEIVGRDTQDNVFITMTYGVLNLRSGVFRFCRAGHEPLLCCKGPGKKVESYSPNGIALGIVADDMFSVVEEVEVNLKSEETAILYTDGVAEAMNEASEEYGEERLIDVILGNSRESAETITNEILRDIDKFTDGISQHDDITIVVLRWVGGRQETREVEAAGKREASAT